MRRIRQTLVVPVLLVAAASPWLTSSSSTAVAGPICVAETVDTIATAPVTVGPLCVPYGGTTTCGATSVAFTPWVTETTSYCLPIDIPTD